MKKKNLKNLVLNKKSISNLGKDKLTGGTLVIKTISCEPFGICGHETQHCETKHCGTQVGCVPTNSCPQTTNCHPSISCKPFGIC